MPEKMRFAFRSLRFQIVRALRLPITWFGGVVGFVGLLEFASTKKNKAKSESDRNRKAKRSESVALGKRSDLKILNTQLVQT